MKNIATGLAALLLGAALLTACTDDDGITARQMPAVDVTTRTLQPNATGSAGESGSVRAYVGAVVTAQGFNLDRVSHVTFAAAVEDSEEVEAEIVEQSIKELKFKVPALGLAQRDDSYAADLRVYGDNGDVVFRYVYYVTIPVTDAHVTGYSPASGTVGTVIKIEGRNLDQITEVRFADQLVRSDEFVEAAAGSISFAVPAGTYAAGESDAAIAAVWGGENTIDVTGDTPFKMQTPNPDAVAQPEGENAQIGDELTITGEYLDLVSAIKWGTYDLIMLEPTAESIRVKFPSSIDVADPVVVAADITAAYGVPAQSIVLAVAYRVDTTPQGPAKPLFTSYAAEDGGDDQRLYLGKQVTVTGENMASVEKFLVDGVDAALVGTPSDVQAVFTVPDGVTFTEATEVKIEAVYDGGSKAEMFTAKVYPFYYWKDVKLGSGSSSTAKFAYPEFAWTNAFFLPDTGEVISVDEWWERGVDSFVKEGKSAMSAAVTLDKTNVTTSEQYYGVQPYLFITTGSDGKLAWQNPSNSDSQLAAHRYGGGKTSLPKLRGTPIIFFSKGLKATDEFVSKVIDGSVESLDTKAYSTIGGANAPAFGDTKDWIVGQVIAVQYVTYTKGGKPGEEKDIHKQGFMYVKEVTCGDTEKSVATDLNGYVKFDFYWSKMLNE